MRDFRDLVQEIKKYVETSEDPNGADFVRWLARRPFTVGLAVRDVYYICLGRLPETAEISVMPYQSREECAAQVMACLLCEEFLHRLPEILLPFFPDIERHFFVHIPKTGGTTLRRATERHRNILMWNDGIGVEDWYSYEPEFYGERGENFILKFLAQFGGDCPTTFYYGGHVSLPKLLQQRFIRPQDQSVAVIREPVELLRSAINYIFTIANGYDRTPDAKDWTCWIQSIDDSWEPGTPPGKALIKSLVRSDRFRRGYSNVICGYLSPDCTIQGALDAIEIARCTIVPMEQMAAYARDALGISGPLPRENGSVDYIGEADAFDRELEDDLRRLCALDVELVRLLRGTQADDTWKVARHAGDLENLME